MSKKRELPTFTLNEQATWWSQAGGSGKEKRGAVVEVVRANTAPQLKVERLGLLVRPFHGTRNHESYIVKVHIEGKKGGTTMYYWPRVSALKKVEKPKAAPYSYNLGA